MYLQSEAIIKSWNSSVVGDNMWYTQRENTSDSQQLVQKYSFVGNFLTKWYY